jgi:DNA-binding ferritin-like protein
LFRTHGEKTVGRSIGDYKEWARLDLDKKGAELVSGDSIVKELCEAHEKMVEYLKKDYVKVEKEYGDPAVAEFIACLMDMHREMNWKLKAHCPGGKN